MAVLVTGGTGFIGSHTCICLYERGYEPILLDNLSNSDEQVVDQLKQITGRSFTFINGDLRDKNRVQQVFKDFEIEAVFHFAALKAVGESTDQPLAYFQNNVAGTLQLLECMHEARVNSFIFSSSATVYGDPHYLPIDETHPIRATNPYGRTKVMIEEILQDYCEANPDFMALSLRYFNPVGAHISGLIGENPNGIPNNLMPFIAQTATGERDKVAVFGSDYDTLDGTGVRDYIHVMDLADGHIAAFDKNHGNSGFHAFNLGTGNGFSVLALINAFSRASEREIPFEFAERRKGDIACSFADASKANKHLDWFARRSLEDMANDSWRWQQNLNKDLRSKEG
jgi:UDP-glucose 4-epimerase